MPYRVTVEGTSYSTDDLTLDEAVAIEKATGISWLYLNPVRSAEHCKAIMVAFLSRDRTPAEAEAVVGKLSLAAATAAVTDVEDDLPDEYEDGIPKAGADPSTPTS